ncbi:MAG: BON domain-containing protein [Acidobacteriota bacterium]
MRMLIRLILVVVLLAVAAVVLPTYWPDAPWNRPGGYSSPPAGTTGTIDKERAREVGAEVGEKTAAAAEKVRDATHDVTITTKIKAKMALDDLVKARRIDVSTDGSTVTLSGTTGSVAEHNRALALARETDGVSQVIDRIQVSSR